MRKRLLVTLALLATMLPVQAQEPVALIDWFDPPAWLEHQQPPRADATMLLDVTVDGWDHTRLFLAEDWAAVQWPTRGVTIYDYRLHAVIASGAHAETTARPLGQEPLWRLDQLRHAGEAVSGVDACEAETSFGVSLPDGPFRGNARLERDGDMLTVTCGGRVVSSLVLSADTDAPASLWPTLANELGIHPRLAGELASLPRAPQSISTLDRDGKLYVAFSLQGAETISVPYPLDGEFRASPHSTFIDDGVAALVREFVAGKVESGEAPAMPSVSRFPGFLGEMQLRAEELPNLIASIRIAPADPDRWMDLSDYYVVHDDPLAAIALVGLAHDLPGGPEDGRVKLWITRLRGAEALSPQFLMP